MGCQQQYDADKTETEMLQQGIAELIKLKLIFIKR